MIWGYWSLERCTTPDHVSKAVTNKPSLYNVQLLTCLERSLWFQTKLFQNSHCLINFSPETFCRRRIHHTKWRISATEHCCLITWPVTIEKKENNSWHATGVRNQFIFLFLIFFYHFPLQETKSDVLDGDNKDKI